MSGMSVNKTTFTRSGYLDGQDIDDNGTQDAQSTQITTSTNDADVVTEVETVETTTLNGFEDESDALAAAQEYIDGDQAAFVDPTGRREQFEVESGSEVLRRQIEADFDQDGDQAVADEEVRYEVVPHEIDPGVWSVDIIRTETVTRADGIMLTSPRPGEEGDPLDDDAIDAAFNDNVYTPHEDGLAIQPGVSGEPIEAYQTDLRGELEEDLGIDGDNVTRILGTTGNNGDGVDGFYGPRTQRGDQLRGDLLALEEQGIEIDYDGLNEYLAGDEFDPESVDPIAVGNFVNLDGNGDYAPEAIITLPSGTELVVPPVSGDGTTMNADPDDSGAVSADTGNPDWTDPTNYAFGDPETWFGPGDAWIDPTNYGFGDESDWVAMHTPPGAMYTESGQPPIEFSPLYLGSDVNITGDVYYDLNFQLQP